MTAEWAHALHHVGSMRQSFAALAAALALASCVSDVGGNEAQGDPADYDDVGWSGPDGKGDVSGIPALFDRHLIMTDELMHARNAVDAAALQDFFEMSPYGTRSWLADHTIDGKRFSEVLAAESAVGGIDPIVLLARMQVESSLVSATVKPSSSKLSHALGCGCPDSRACSAAYSGLVNQLRCATEVLNARHADSVSGQGEWALQKTKKTLDPISVTPRTHATAALYAYTPWVLVGRGGNWLVWNVTRKYLKHFDEAGTLHLP
jgi:hypothetical protein